MINPVWSLVPSTIFDKADVFKNLSEAKLLACLSAKNLLTI